MRNNFIILSLLVFIPLLSFATGCKKGPETGQVSGTVTFEGKPLEKGAIIFDVAGARMGRAEINNGQIENATTYKPGDGIALGEARIAITAIELVGGSGSNNSGQADHSKMSFKPGGHTDFKSLIPARYSKVESSGLKTTIVKGNNELDLKLVR